ncbi:MAG: hypothetical protein LBR32_06660 [Propionibacteriaceae bacterium]|jgi:hypothetical protein|nr:hypothetical protein [Propionibacteriaceae bacterium]
MLHTQQWVDAAPFRAHLEHVLAATGLPWPAVALHAGVSPATARSLLFGRSGFGVQRISPQCARRLLGLDIERVSQLKRRQVPSRQTALRVERLLDSGCDAAWLARWCHLSAAELRNLPDQPFCSELTALLVQSACLEDPHFAPVLKAA